jgi:hypothetical protein
MTYCNPEKVEMSDSNKRGRSQHKVGLDGQEKRLGWVEGERIMGGGWGVREG